MSLMRLLLPVLLCGGVMGVGELHHAGQVWEALQERCCVGFDQLQSTAEHAQMCASLHLDEDFTQLRGVARRRRREATRVLFLVTSQLLFEAFDRALVYDYAGVCQQDEVESVMWGVGFPGFSELESLDDNIRRWFQDPHFDLIHTSQEFIRSIAASKVKKVGSNYTPFLKSITSVMSRASEFKVLSSNPIVSLTVDELGERDLEDIHELRPNILGLRYEQHLGAGKGVAGIHLPNASSVHSWCGEVDIEGCPLNHKLQEYMRMNIHTLLVHIPHCVNPDIFNAIRMRQLKDENRKLNVRELKLNSPSNNTDDEKDINRERNFNHNALLFGALLHVYYPLRTTMRQAMEYTSDITHFVHPGHGFRTDGFLVSRSCHAHELVLEHLDEYITALSKSRICLIGSGSSGSNDCRNIEWTLRKYYEAAAAGCVIIGDIPADSDLASFIPMRLSGLDAMSVAKKVMEAVALHKYNKYNDLAQLSAEYVLTERSCKSVMSSFYIPAVKDYALGGRVGGVYVSNAARNLTNNKKCAEENISNESLEVKKTVLWAKSLSLAAEQAHESPTVLLEVLADHPFTPEEQVRQFCFVYQIISPHCDILIEIMNASLK